MKLKKLILAVTMAVLGLSAAVLLLSFVRDSKSPKKGFQYSPDLGGWEIEELPIGPNEFLEEVTREVLGFSYCRNFKFRRGPECFEVFVAFWDRGTVSEREVAGHVPEICFVRQGLELEEKVEIRNDDLDFPMWSLEFSLRDEKLSVVYFHMADGDIVGHHRAGSPVFSSYISRLLSGELSFKKRQLLVRIAFPCPALPSGKIANHEALNEILRKIIENYKA